MEVDKYRLFEVDVEAIYGRCMAHLAIGGSMEVDRVKDTIPKGTIVFCGCGFVGQAEEFVVGDGFLHCPDCGSEKLVPEP